MSNAVERITPEELLAALAAKLQQMAPEDAERALRKQLDQIDTRLETNAERDARVSTIRTEHRLVTDRIIEALSKVELTETFRVSVKVTKGTVNVETPTIVSGSFAKGTPNVSGGTFRELLVEMIRSNRFPVEIDTDGYNYIPGPDRSNWLRFRDIGNDRAFDIRGTKALGKASADAPVRPADAVLACAQHYKVPGLPDETGSAIHDNDNTAQIHQAVMDYLYIA